MTAPCPQKIEYASVFDLDLEPIMVKAVDNEEGYGWSIEFTKEVSEEYKKYLHLCKKFPEKAIVPSTYVDDFWHMHILDTIKYEEDCNFVFGEFLHHFPYFGMRGEDDAKNLSKAWAETLSLYESEFESKPSERLWPKSQRCPNCGVRCKGSIGNNAMSAMRPRLSSLSA